MCVDWRSTCGSHHWIMDDDGNLHVGEAMDDGAEQDGMGRRPNQGTRHH